MIEPQDCRDCIFAEGWTEPHGERVSFCNHRERFEQLWGDNPGEYFAVNECPLYADREAVRAAINGVEL